MQIEQEWMSPIVCRMKSNFIWLQLYSKLKLCLTFQFSALIVYWHYCSSTVKENFQQKVSRIVLLCQAHCLYCYSSEILYNFSILLMTLPSTSSKSLASELPNSFFLHCTVLRKGLPCILAIWILAISVLAVSILRIVTFGNQHFSNCSFGN